MSGHGAAGARSRPAGSRGARTPLRLVECIRAAAFDVDGTLVDSAPDLAASANAMLVALAHGPLQETRIADLIGNGVDRLIEGVLEASTGRVAAAAAVEVAGKLFRRMYAQRLFDRSRVYAGATEGLQALRERGIRLCCVTNKPSAFTLPLLEAAQLARHFEFTLCADRAEERKPAPYLLLAACDRMGIAPHDMLYVGDSRTDIAAARAAGMAMAAVDYGYNQGRALADDDPDWIIGSLVDIMKLPVSPGTSGTAA